MNETKTLTEIKENKTNKLLNELGLSYNDIGSEKLINILDSIDLNDVSKKLDIDLFTNSNKLSV